MKSLSDLLKTVPFACGESDIDRCMVSEITVDSRKARPGSVFVAVPGGTADGHTYIGQAIENGCAALVVEKSWYEHHPLPVSLPVAVVSDSRAALGAMATEFFGHPAKNMVLVGVTGTNGKTTFTYLLENIIRCGGGRPGVIGTINYRFNGVELPATHTTPDPVALQALLRMMADSGVTHVVMEASSHALEQKRLAGVLFDVGVFTNLTHDHLDYHLSMESYFNAKKRLFLEYLKEGGAALVVLNEGESGIGSDAWSIRLVRELQDCQRHLNFSLATCGQSSDADIWVEVKKNSVSGISGVIQAGKRRGIPFESALVGNFNVKNIVGVVGAALSIGAEDEAITGGINRLRVVPGRMQKITAFDRLEGGNDFTVFVDYAHTPDALKNVLVTLRALGPRKIITVFGCGGDRDKTKRSMMGMVAGTLVDFVIVTNDNPRSEDPMAIAQAICAGLEEAGREQVDLIDNEKGIEQGGYLVVLDRREAIRVALQMAGTADIVLICGKGHEEYQIAKGEKIFFDDRVEAQRCLKGLAASAR